MEMCEDNPSDESANLDPRVQVIIIIIYYNTSQIGTLRRKNIYLPASVNSSYLLEGTPKTQKIENASNLLPPPQICGSPRALSLELTLLASTLNDLKRAIK